MNEKSESQKETPLEHIEEKKDEVAEMYRKESRNVTLSVMNKKYIE